MAYANVTFLNFASGELSPKLRSRSDLKIYPFGCERLQNFICETQGPLKFRTGTHYVHHTRLNQVARLIEFQFSDIQAYILEFTDQYVRFYKDGGLILESAQAVTGITQANPGVVTIAGHGYANGDEVFVGNVVGMDELNGYYFLVANVTANTFTLQDIDGNDIDTTDYDAYTSGGTISRVYEIASPYAEADLAEIQTAQDYNDLYAVHPSYAPQVITRTGHTSWTLGTYVRTADPFVGANDYPAAIAFYESRLAYACTNNNPASVWMSRSPGSTGVSRYTDHTLGANADDALAVTIASFRGKANNIEWLASNTEFLTVGMFGGTAKLTGSGSEEAISPGSINVKHIDAFGCTSREPVSSGANLMYIQRGNRVINSFELEVISDNFASVDRNLVADHITISGITEIAYQNGRPDILWAVRNDGLLIGLTFKGKEDVSGWHRHPLGGDGSALSIGVIPQENAFDQVWVVVEREIDGVTRRYVEYLTEEVVFPDFSEYYTDTDSYTDDYSAYLNDLKELQKGYIYLDSSITYDGSIYGDIAGASVTPAAVTGSGIVFTASAAVFEEDMVGRQIWKKSVDGVGTGRATITAYTNTTTVECKITVDFDSTDAIAATEWYLTADSLSGVDHLEGESVGIVTDGAVHPDGTVEDGSVSLDYQASVIHVGEKYRGFMRSMNVEGAGVSGSAQTKTRNVERIGIKFYESLGARYGTNEYDLEAIPFRSTADIMDRPSPMFSGVKVVDNFDDWRDEKKVMVSQESPLPCTIQMLDIYMDATNE